MICKSMKICFANGIAETGTQSLSRTESLSYDLISNVIIINKLMRSVLNDYSIPHFPLLVQHNSGMIFCSLYNAL